MLPDAIAYAESDIVFLAKHPTLRQLAQEIGGGLSQAIKPDRRILVYCGVHKPFGQAWYAAGTRIGIQTEQLVDQTGDPLWGAHKKELGKRVSFALCHCDHWLDMSCSNRLYYETLRVPDAVLSKITYGPHIFPHTPPAFDAVKNPDLVFFGNLNPRRKAMIERVNATVRVVPEGTYQEALTAEISKARAVLNVHFADGVYSEAPRILTAVSHGKPIVSETLAEPFKAGKHYITLDSAIEAVDLSAYYERLSAFLSQNYSFSGYLLKLLEHPGVN